MSSDKILHYLLFTLGTLAGLVAGFVAEQIDIYLGMKRLSAYSESMTNKKSGEAPHDEPK